MKRNSSAQEVDNTSAHEASFSRQVSTIIEKFERQFRSSEATIAKIEGEAELERRRAEFNHELLLMRVYLLENRPSIEHDDGEELKEKIANKLAISSPNKADSIDWWWIPANHSIQEILSEVQRALDKATNSKAQPWRRGMFYAWCILTEMIYLAIVVAVFSAATSQFETVVFSALVMIYNVVSSRISGIGLVTMYLMYQTEEAYGEIGRALGLKVPVSPAREAAEQIRKTSAVVLIHNVSIGIGSLIALWHLVAAILP